MPDPLLWDPVASARFFDDRPWGGVEAFVRGVVAGNKCLSDLGGGGGNSSGDNRETGAILERAGVCPGKVGWCESKAFEPRAE
jgi:hypothetical protein